VICNTKHILYTFCISVGYFYKNVICFSDRVLRMNINTYVLRTVHVFVLCVIRN